MPDSLVTEDLALRALNVFVGKTKPHPENMRLLVRDMRAALEAVEGDMVKGEREDCARTVSAHIVSHWYGSEFEVSLIASAIRARTEKAAP